MHGTRSLGSARERLAAMPFADLVSLFGRWIDFTVLDFSDQRRRLFPYQATFWLYLAQLLSPGMSCAEAVKMAAASLLFAGRKAPSPNSSAYCQARKRLPCRIVTAIGEQAKAVLSHRVAQRWLWHGHHVKVVDATHVSVEDTAANRCFGYPTGVRTPAGFPTIKVLAFFSLQTGALLDYLAARNRRSEQSLLRSLWRRALEAGDVLLGDRFYCSFAHLAKLSRASIHLVVRQNATLSTSLVRGRRLGRRDFLCQWRRTHAPSVGFSWAAWRRLPSALTVRQIEVIVEEPGMRTKKFLLLTTLLDHRAYPARDFAALYRRRWEIELCFRNIKVTMGMEQLACKTPEMVRKQLALQVVAYNLVRLIMLEAALAHRVALQRLSFKGATDLLRHFAPRMARARESRETNRLYKALLACIAAGEIPPRPGRREPRAVKSRCKGYETLTKPRHLFREKTKGESLAKARRPKQPRSLT